MSLQKPEKNVRIFFFLPREKDLRIQFLYKVQTRCLQPSIFVMIHHRILTNDEHLGGRAGADEDPHETILHLLSAAPLQLQTNPTLQRAPAQPADAYAQRRH